MCQKVSRCADHNEEREMGKNEGVDFTVRKPGQQTVHINERSL